MKKVENMLKNPKIHYDYRYPLPDEWLSRKTDHLKNGFGFSYRPETFHHTKNQVNQSTPTHFLSDLFFLIAIRPVVGL